MDISFFSIESILPVVIGLILGLIIGRLLAKPKQLSSSLANSDDLKLNNEVLEDQVKQLEAKIKTLEKALEISNK